MHHTSPCLHLPLHQGRIALGVFRFRFGDEGSSHESRFHEGELTIFQPLWQLTHQSLGHPTADCGIFRIVQCLQLFEASLEANLLDQLDGILGCLAHLGQNREQCGPISLRDISRATIAKNRRCSGGDSLALFPYTSLRPHRSALGTSRSIGHSRRLWLRC